MPLKPPQPPPQNQADWDRWTRSLVINPTALTNADLITQHMVAIRAFLQPHGISTADVTADMVTQHMNAIRAFLPQPQPERGVNDAQLILASRVFGNRQ